MQDNITTPTHESAQISPPKRGRKAIPVDAAKLERLASTLPTQLAVALELDISHTTLARKLLDSAELRRAWEQGRAVYEASRPKPETRVARASRRLSPAADFDDFEDEAGDEVEATPERARVVAPAPVCGVGTPGERVLAAIARGHRTFGELMSATGLKYDAVVLTVQRLACAGRVVARSDGHVRLHYLAEKMAR